MTKKELCERLKQIENMEELNQFIEEVESSIKNPGEPMPDSIRRKIGIANGRKVKCVETGKVYDSVGHAASELGIKYCQSVWQAAVKGGTTHGYHFKYVI